MITFNLEVEMIIGYWLGLLMLDFIDLYNMWTHYNDIISISVTNWCFEILNPSPYLDRKFI